MSPFIGRYRTRRVYDRRVGFTLVEVVIVVVILSLMAAIAVPRFATAMQGSAIDMAAQRLAADLRVAQAFAIKKQQQQSVVIDLATNAYTFVGMPHPDHPDGTFVVTFGDAMHRGVRIASADFDGGNILTFDRFGGPSAPGTIVLQSTNKARTVRVGSGAGRITVE